MIRTLIIIAAVVAITSLGCGSKQPPQAAEVMKEQADTVEDRIKDNIKDQRTQAHLLLLLEDLKINNLEMHHRFGQFSQELRANPTHTIEQLDALLTRYREMRRMILYENAAIGIEMRRLVTREQWTLIYPVKEEKKGDKK